MSVYTTVSEEQLRQYLSHYRVGELAGYQGISAGIENTNYFVDTELDGQRQRFVLTLFETYAFEEMPYFLELMEHLASRGVPSARPVADCDGQLLRELNDRPAALVERLDGADVDRPGPEHVAAIGRAMAQMHLAGLDYPGHRENCRSFPWWDRALEQLAPHIASEDRELIADEIAFQRSLDRSQLPAGVIHADLFHDNALFADDGSLAGIIDFYFACNDVLVYDIAVALNDWCVDDRGELDSTLCRPFFDAYQQIRAMEDIEREQLPVLLRAGALRFWLSRLVDYHFPREGEVTHCKDPGHFRQILLLRRREQTDFQSLVA
ncbi:MAG: homoserine kinase [Pseudomonadota bacterium]